MAALGDEGTGIVFTRGLSREQRLLADRRGVEVADLFLNFLDSFRDEAPAQDGSGMLDKVYQRALVDLVNKEMTTMFVDFSHVMLYSDELQQIISEEFYRMDPFLQMGLQRFAQRTMPEVFRNHERRFDLHVAFYKLPRVHNLRQLGTAEVGKLVSVSGVVTRTSEVRPELLSGTFKCLDCNNTIRDVEQQFKYTPPLLCTNATCANRQRFSLLRHESVFDDWQKVRMQENTSEIPAGSLPRTLEVILRHEIVEQARAGDRCIFTGTVVVIPDIQALLAPGDRTEASKENAADHRSGAGEGVRGLKALGVRDLSYRLAFIAKCVQPHDKKNTINFHMSRKEGEDEETPTFTDEELAQIHRMQNMPQLYDRLVKSIAPTVFGHHEIKRAIVLMLLSGVHKKTHEGIKLRGDINVCIVGDPSCAKSQFLKYVARFLPRAVYTSGKSTSAAGLTASVVKEPETGEFCIEAGALMLADNGICCIDEFDKMDVKDQVAIHEAMEQQTISITKAGIQATLNARTSILAAANPAGGRYDKSKPLKYNVALPPAILSRFDLVHVMIDDPDDDLDYNIARHIIGVHQKREAAVMPEFTTAELQRYIAYGRALKPELSTEAREALIEAYVALRRGDAAPGTQVAYRITVRQLEALIRLSEAIARLHCDDKVRSVHVREARRLLSTSIISVDSHEIDLDQGRDDNDNDDDDDDRDILQHMDIPQGVPSSGEPDQDDHASEEAPSTGADAMEVEGGDDDRQRGKMKVTYEQLSKITHALVLKLRQHEESLQEDVGLAGLKQKELVEWYIAEQNAKNAYSSVNELVEEIKRLRAVIQHLINREGTLIVIDDGTAAVEAAQKLAEETGAEPQRLKVSDERVLAVNPNYDME